MSASSGGLVPKSTLLTLGHGRLDEGTLGSLLRGASVALLVDVRRFPGSRANPAVSREALSHWLPKLDIEYRWEERLGGRRSRPLGEDEDPWWRVDAFGAYAAHTRTPEFREAMRVLLSEAAERRAAVMCSESVWWRCHRRLIADVAVLAHGKPVRHLMHDGRQTEHRPSEGARVRPDGLVVWDRV
jgi:uncharacterized protein (DUF488 family)